MSPFDFKNAVDINPSTPQASGGSSFDFDNAVDVDTPAAFDFEAAVDVPSAPSVNQQPDTGYSFSDFGRDAGAIATNAAINVGQGAYGLANLATEVSPFRQLGLAAQKYAGYEGPVPQSLSEMANDFDIAPDFGEARNIVNSMKSRKLQADQASLEAAQAGRAEEGLIARAIGGGSDYITRPALLASTALEQAGSFVGGGAAAKSASAAALLKGATPAVAAKAGERAALLTGAAQEAGAAAEQADSTARKLTDEQKANSEAYQDLRARGLTDAQAIEQLTNRAQLLAAPIAGLSSLAIGKLSGSAALESDIFTRKLSGDVSKRIAGAPLAAAKEGLSGAVEEGASQFGGNVGERYGLGLDTELSKGVAEAAGAGAVLEGSIGGVGRLVAPGAKPSVEPVPGTVTATLSNGVSATATPSPAPQVAPAALPPIAVPDGAKTIDVDGVTLTIERGDEDEPDYFMAPGIERAFASPEQFRDYQRQQRVTPTAPAVPVQSVNPSETPNSSPPELLPFNTQVGSFLLPGSKSELAPLIENLNVLYRQGVGGFPAGYVVPKVSVEALQQRLAAIQPDTANAPSPAAVAADPALAAPSVLPSGDQPGGNGVAGGSLGEANGPAVADATGASGTSTAKAGVVAGGEPEPAAALKTAEFVPFAKESGTLGIPRAEMPQVKAEHRGALVNFLNARGIAHEQVEVEAASLKATQAEYSPAKVQKAKDFTGGNRSILVSSDGYIVDGHHQALAAVEKGEPIKAIRLDAPVRELLPLVREFPSSTTAEGATTANAQTNSAQQPQAKVREPDPFAATKQPKRQKPKTSADLADTARRVLLAEIRSLGGIERAEMADITGEGRKNPKTGKISTRAGGQVNVLFTKNGVPLDRVRERMGEMGYFADDGDVTGNLEQVREIVRAALDGDAAATVPMATRAEYAELQAIERAAADEAAGLLEQDQFEKQRAAIQYQADELLSEDERADLAARFDDDTEYFDALQEAVNAKRNGDEADTAGKGSLEVSRDNDRRQPGQGYGGGQVDAQAGGSEDRRARTEEGTADGSDFALEQQTEGDLRAKDGRASDASIAQREQVDREAAATRGESFLQPSNGSTTPAPQQGSLIEGPRASDVRPQQRKDVPPPKGGLFSLTGSLTAPTSERSLPLSQVQSIVDGIKAKWQNAPDIVVLSSLNDPNAPAAARSANDAQQSQGAQGRPRGFFYRGTVYIVADAQSSDKSVMQTLFHEALGHAGLRGAFGQALLPVLDDIATRRRMDVDQKLKQYGFAASIAQAKELIAAERPDLDADAVARLAPDRVRLDRLRAAEEVLAQLAESRPEIGFVQNAVIAIRKFLRELGFKVPLSNPEIIKDYLLPARRYIENAKQPKVVDRQNQLSVDRLQPAFARSPSTKAAYEKRIEELFGGSLPNYKGAKVLDRADILGLLGHGDKPLYLAEGAVNKPKDGMPRGSAPKHPGMTEDQWKNVPVWVENPVAAFRSQDKSHPDRIVLIGPELVNGRPVRMILEPNAGMGGLDVHIAVNAYEESGTNITPVQDWVKKGDLLYLDQKRSPAFSGRSGLQLPGEVRSLRGYSTKVKTELDLVKYVDERRGADRDAGYLVDFSRTVPAGNSTPAGAATNDPDNIGGLLTETKGQWLYRKFVNNFSEVERAIKFLRGTQTIADEQDPTSLRKTFDGRTQSRIDTLKGQTQAMFKALNDAGVSFEAASDYIYALHAKERNDAIAAKNSRFPDGGSGMTNAEAAQIIKDARALPATQYQALQDAAKVVRQINQAKLQGLRDNGLISQDQLDQLNAAYKNYVPLKTIKDEDGGAKGTGAGFDQRSTVVREAFGRASRAESPLAVALLDAQKAIVRAEKNRIGLSIYELIQRDPTSQMMRVLPSDEWPQSARTVTKKDAQGNDYTETVYSPNVSDLYKRDNIFMARVDGKLVVMEMQNEKLALQLKNMGSEQVPRALELWGMGTKLFGRLLTQWNPEFALPNLIRDMETAYLNAFGANTDLNKRKFANGVLKNLRKGAVAAFKGESDPAYKEFLDAGASTGAYGFQDLSDIKGQFERIVAEERGGGASRLNLIGRNLINKVERFNEVFENTTRFAIFKSARDNGASVQQAARLAKETTVNFNQRGEDKILGSLYVFFNAAIQGNVAMLRAAKNSRITQAAMLGLLVAGLLESAFEPEDDEGELKKDYAGDWSFGREFVQSVGENTFIKVPIAYGYNVPYAMGRIMGRVVKGRMTAAEGAGGVLSSMLSTFLPVDSPVPTIAQPVVSVATNNTERGKTIYRPAFGDTRYSPVAYRDYGDVQLPGGLGSLSKAMQALHETFGGSRHTPNVIKEVTGMDPFSAAGTEALFKDYFGAQIRMVSNLVGLGVGAANLAAESTGNERLTAEQPFNANDVPVARRFFNERQPYYTAKRFNEVAREAQAMSKDLKEMSYQERQNVPQPERNAAAKIELVAKTERKVRKELEGVTDPTRKREIEARLEALRRRGLKLANDMRAGLNVREPETEIETE